MLVPPLTSIQRRKAQRCCSQHQVYNIGLPSAVKKSHLSDCSWAWWLTWLLPLNINTYNKCRIPGSYRSTYCYHPSASYLRACSLTFHRCELNAVLRTKRRWKCRDCNVGLLYGKDRTYYSTIFDCTIQRKNNWYRVASPPLLREERWQSYSFPC